MQDGTVFRKTNYATSNIKVQLPLQYVDDKQPELPSEYEGFGGRPLEAPSDSGGKKIHNHK
jgi:hypothetical protein